MGCSLERRVDSALGSFHCGRCGERMHHLESGAVASGRIARAMRIVSGTVIVAVSGGLVAGCGSSGSINHSEAGCGRSKASSACLVLFIGNSYTYVNDLPVMFARLANAGDHAVEAGMVAEGGASLADHAASLETGTALRSAKWNVVVLQEQSEIPSSGRLRQTLMYPAARQLVRMIREVGAQPMFYLTWAHRDGWPANGLFGYTSMQSAIDEGYSIIARELHVTVAPVGEAWSDALSREAHSGFWQTDGSHPTVKGTYLAACVFYATIFGQSPEGLRYHADLPDREAAELQVIASSAVLGSPVR
jgi:hypothetical protein